MGLFGGKHAKVDDPAHKTGEIIQKLQLLARVEGQIARFYELCSETFPIEREFWEDMAEEERRHVQFITKMEELVKSVPQQFEPTPILSVAAIRLFELSVRDLPTRKELESMEKDTLMEVVKEVESSAVEMNFGKIVATENKEFKKLAAQVDKETRTHHQNLENKMICLDPELSPRQQAVST